MPSPEKPEEKPEKKSLVQRFGKACRSMKLRDMRGAAIDTLVDMRKPAEVVTFAAAVIVPGGLPAWGVYRMAKYKMKSVGNDNDDTAAPAGKRKKQRKGPKGP